MQTSNKHLMLVLLPILILSACRQVEAPTEKLATAQIPNEIPNENLETATFAGGCFWCTESDFDKIPGVVSTTSGYIGGTVVNPTYEQVSTGKTGHVEAVRIHFDNTKTDFSKLLSAYWLTIDPLTADQQFCDIGSQYRSAIFYHNSDQKNLAEVSKKNARSFRALYPTHCDRNSASHRILPSGRISSGLLSQKPITISVLSQKLRT